MEQRATVIDGLEDRIAAGVAMLKKGNAEMAVELLGNTLQEAIEQYGALGVECAPAYLKYGTALLRVAQSNSDVFGQTIEEAAASRAGPSSETPAELNNAAGENGGANAPGSGAPVVTAEPAKVDGDAATKREEGGEGQPGEEEGEEGPAEEGAEESEGGEDDDRGGEDDAEAEADADADGEGEEPPDDLQLAWENVETARVIYSGQDVDAHWKELAEAHDLLGEIAQERETFDIAVQEFEKEIELLEKAKVNDRRWLAEVHYKISLSLEFSEEPEKALGHVDRTAELLQQVIADAEQDMAESVKERQEELKTLVSTQEQMKAALKDAFGLGGGGGLGLGLSASRSKKAAKRKRITPTAAAAAAAAEKGENAAAARNTAAAADGGSGGSVVVNLGVGGRGQRRITPVSQDPAPAAGAAAAASAPKAVSKRKLEDLLDGGRGDGITTIGFEPAAAAPCDRQPAE